MISMAILAITAIPAIATASVMAVIGRNAWLTENILGIRVVEPGCKVIEVKPYLGKPGVGEGSFPTPHGVVKVRHERLPNGKIESKIDAPAGIMIL